MTRIAMAGRRAALAVAAGVTLMAANAAAQDIVGTDVRADVEYAVHDGVSLKGDLYVPVSTGPHPALILIHGGSFRGGSKEQYGRSWGAYLAARGYVVFAIDYRLSTPEQTTWPQALLDCKAAVQFLRGDAAALGVDPERIGVGGDSAGGTLAALVALTQDMPAFANRYPGDAHATSSTMVKVAVPVYGVHDMMSWHRYTLGTGNKGSLEQFIGGTPDQMPGAYFEASPLAYLREAATSLGAVSVPNAGTSIPWFVTWGVLDEVVPPASHSVVLVQALKDAGADVTAIEIPNTGHLFFRGARLTGRQGTPVCEDQSLAGYSCSGPTPNDYIEREFLEFLRRGL
ncbi:MAG: alpha/beta hydrolase [Acidobacteria bacterium]|nr:alpha/beta hydrolase [Acidobacteriota bacterium]